MTAHPPADWYADPNTPGQLRYWDGHQWTEHFAHAPAAAQATTARGGQPDPTRSMVRPGAETAQLIREAARFNTAISESASVSMRHREEASQQLQSLHRQGVITKLDELSLDSISAASSGRLRIGALQQAGYRTVGQLRGVAAAQLQQLNGVGPQTAQQVVAAYKRLERELTRRTGIAFNVSNRSVAQTNTLRALITVLHDRQHLDPPLLDAQPLVESLARLSEMAKPATNRVVFRLRGGATRAAATAAAQELDALVHGDSTSRLLEQLQRGQAIGDGVSRWVETDVWAFFEARSSEIYALAEELAGIASSEVSKGGLPEDIVKRIEAIELDSSLLKVHLRGYQEFGAKYVLAQRRCLLGDEMGLGKTIEALAVVCHLAAKGSLHFKVVAPASVLANWEREVAHRTALPVHKVHGADRRAALARWELQGGVAVTTYETLKSLPAPAVELSMLIVDEAHYAKNPDAQRSQAVRTWSQRADHVLFMSGTPLENRLDEFCTLANYLQPEVATRMRSQSVLAGTEHFRHAAAPVYLRRNQEDVLTELPERIETDEWVELSSADLVHYRDAVASGNLMSVRRAAFVDPRASSKMERLREIVDAARDDGLKVVVFSFFLDVLHAVHRQLGGAVIGVINGSVTAPQRQALIDTFTDHPGHAVLLSQIDAGGVGLNIQAASVVIITEPQWKPSTEEQAIARCHRMGQVRPVQVHRLLTIDSVDEGIRALQHRKAAEFDAYARGSAMKDAAADAVDITDAEATRALMDRETARVAGQQH
jgi:superfamily II DNA or RNA helicase